jgi:hypothetical protein
MSHRKNLSAIMGSAAVTALAVAAAAGRISAAPITFQATAAFQAPAIVPSALAASVTAVPAAAPAASLDDPRFLDVARLPALNESAVKGLSQFRDLAGEGEYKDFGLPDAASAAKAGLGTPKRDFLIRLDALKAFKPGKDIQTLLVDTRIVHYPVVVDGKPAGSLSFVEEKGAWNLVSMGDVQRTALRKRAIDASVKRFARAESEHFIVRVPALNLEFTAFRDRNDELQLASVADNPIAGLTAGEAEPAEKVIARIQPLALEDDGLPH